MTDVLLINPNASQAYGNLYSLTAKEPPVWCLMIAGFLQGKDLTVKILDANALELTHKEVARIVWDTKPVLTAVVCYGHNPSASTQVMPEALRIVDLIKKQNWDRRIALVGGHVAALPEQTLMESKADWVCGDEGFFSLLTAYRYAKHGNMRGTILNAGLAELDDISRLPYELLPMGAYKCHNWHAFGYEKSQPYGSLYTTLGCPHHCEYCNIQAPFKTGEALCGITKNSYRKFSPSQVGQQIDFLAGYGVTHIKFADELFVWDTEHVQGICQYIIDRKYDLNIWAYARVDRLNDDLLRTMRKAGIRWLCLGIEAGDEKVRRDVKKGFKQDVIQEAVVRIQAAGIHIIANYMFGLPEDSLDTMQATLDLACQLNCEYANFYCVQALPGSALYEQARREGWELPATWSGYSQLSADSTPLRTRYLTGKEVRDFRDHAFIEYFDRKAYKDMLKETFGQGAVDEVNRMLRVELKRA